MKMKRPSTLAASILATVLFSLSTLVCLPAFLFLLMLQTAVEVSTPNESGIATGWLNDLAPTSACYYFMALLLLSIVAIVFNAICIKSYVRNKDVYRKFTAFTIITILLDFAYFLTLLTPFYLNYPTTVFGIFVIIVVSVLIILVNVLYIVDMCTEKGRIAKFEEEQRAAAYNLEQQKQALEQSQISEEQRTIAADLKNLEDMKNKNLITDEEYKVMRERILKIR